MELDSANAEKALKEAETVQAKRDVLQTECDSLKKEVEELKTSTDSQDEILVKAKELAGVLAYAATMGLDGVADMASMEEMQGAICKAQLPDIALDGKSADY